MTEQELNALLESDVDTYDKLYSSRILNEAYFGKTKNLREMQSIFHTIRMAANDDSYVHTINKMAEINTSPMMIKFNRLVEKEFGFKTFSLIIEPTVVANAFTLPVSIVLDYNPNIQSKLAKSNNGFRYSKEYGLSTIVVMFSGLFFNKTLTDSEVFAIFLHEIGHNFQTAITGNRGAVFNGISKANTIIEIARHVMDIKNLPSILFLSQTSVSVSRNDLIKSIEDARSKQKEVFNVVFSTYELAKIGFSIFNTVIIVNALINYGPLALLLGLLYQIVKQDVLGLPVLPTNYFQELTADNFVTMYGYSAELSSGLAKIAVDIRKHSVNENMRVAAKSCPFVYILFDMTFNMPIMLLQSIFDAHPTTAFRVKDQAKMLDYEINKRGIDPKMKAELQAQQKRLYKQIDEITTLKDGIKDPDLISHIFERMIYNIMREQSPKEALVSNKDSNSRYKAYDDALDYVMEKNKK